MGHPQHIFDRLNAQAGPFQIDLFASMANHKLPIFYSWTPDPLCAQVDAFTVSWGTSANYAFPPFSLIPKCLQKIEQEEAELNLVIPYWPTQPWFPRAVQLLATLAILLPKELS